MHAAEGERSTMQLSGASGKDAARREERRRLDSVGGDARSTSPKMSSTKKLPTATSKGVATEEAARHKERLEHRQRRRWR